MTTNTLRQLFQIAAFTLLVSVCGVHVPMAAAAPDHQPVVEELIDLLDAEPSLDEALRAAIREADLQELENKDAFLGYLDGLVTLIPTERVVVPECLKFYYVVNQAPDDRLNQDDQFNAWMKRLVRTWGEFLDTPASAQGIGTFTLKPSYRIDDYFAGPSGWQTFNQFFAREVRPGKRPVAAPRDDTVVVSPADAVYMGQWPINEDANITVKGVNWSIRELLDGSPYADAFQNGIYTHSFLYIDDYHRYHVPVAGVVKEVRNIHGKVYMDVTRQDDGTLDVFDGDTYQFNQERGLVVIDSPEAGLVAVLPIGMAYVSSVNLTPKVGAYLRKGDQFGYFLFGGSDIVTLYQSKDVVLDAEIGVKYLQGERLGQIRK